NEPGVVGIALPGRNHIFVVDKRHDPLFRRPNSRAVRIDVLTYPIVEELDPCSRRPGFERVHVVAHFEQIAAGRATINNFKQAILPLATVNALKPRFIVHENKPSPRLRATAISKFYEPPQRPATAKQLS